MAERIRTRRRRFYEHLTEVGKDELLCELESCALHLIDEEAPEHGTQEAMVPLQICLQVVREREVEWQSVIDEAAEEVVLRLI